MKYVYQVIDIVNEEPLKIGANGNKTSWDEPCKDYIPGSTLRGAIIAQLLNQKKCSEGELAPFLQKMFCYNAYPFDLEALYIPTPQHLRIDKHDWRRAKARRTKDSFVSLANLIYFESISENEQKKNSLEFPYVAIKKKMLQGTKIKKRYHLHHSHSRNKHEREKDNLFSYQAIEPGYTFRTVIMLDEQINSKVIELFQKQSVWYLGGSKGSGYGKCSIKLVEEPKYVFAEVKKLLYPELKDHTTTQNEVTAAQIVITCLSDCIFRNEHGQPINTIPDQIFDRLIGKQKPVIKQSYIQTALSEGFNSKWNARYPKETTLKAGSILVYQLPSELTSEEYKKLINGLESRPWGQRTQDGFGWLAVNILYPDQLKVAKTEIQNINLHSPATKNRIANQDSLTSPIMDTQLFDETDQAVLNIMQKGMADSRRKWLRMIVKRTLDNPTEIQHSNSSIVISTHVSASQMDNMERVIHRWLAEYNLGGDYEQMNLLKQKSSQISSLFSIANCNFKDIIAYLMDSDKAEQANSKKLMKYASEKLNSRSGYIYYGNRDTATQKRFIAELTKEALNYGKKRVES